MFILYISIIIIIILFIILIIRTFHNPTSKPSTRKKNKNKKKTSSVTPVLVHETSRTEIIPVPHSNFYDTLEPEWIHTTPLLPENKNLIVCDKNVPYPHPRIIGQIFSKDQCEEMIRISQPHFKRSILVGGSTSSIRTSESARFERNHPLSIILFNLAYQLTGKPSSHCEDVQVVKYMPGAEYKPHHDACCDSTNACIDFLKQGGNRVSTLLVYLNDDFEEGHTSFPELDLLIKAPPGSGIFFITGVFMEGNYISHPYALHAGTPVKNGIKYACNVWVREHVYVPR